MVLNSQNLVEVGRELKTPFEVELILGGETKAAQCVQVLRLVPERRVVVKMLVGEQAYLGKIFIGTNKEKYLKRERSGIEALQEASVSTAKIKGEAQLADGGADVLLLDFLPDVRHLSALIVEKSGNGPDYLTLAVSMMATLHEQGLQHEDCHLNNFLISDDALHLVDGDAVKPLKEPKQAAAIENLALFFVQLPLSLSGRFPQLFSGYCSLRGWRLDELLPVFEKQIRSQRSTRQRRFLNKVFRDCTQFKVTKTWSRFVAMDRQSETVELVNLIENPDGYIESGKCLKDGNSATVALVELNGQPFVLKRYNIKSFGHWLSRCWRPSRAWLSWHNAQFLRFYDIDTPKPLAMVEQRCGFLRGKAYFITEYLGAEDVLGYVQKMAAQPAILEGLAVRFASLFGLMKLLRFSHGDLKATNFLLKNDVLSVIDLDSMRVHASDEDLSNALEKDKQRFIKNWAFDKSVESIMVGAFNES